MLKIKTLMIMDVVLLVIAIVLIFTINSTFACDINITKVSAIKNKVTVLITYHNKPDYETKKGAIIRCTAYNADDWAIGTKTEFISGEIPPGFTKEIEIQITLYGVVNTVTDRVKCTCLEY